jgi:hypothetical protein
MNPRAWMFLSLLSVPLLILGCDMSTLSVPQQALPTAIPGAIDVLVAQTAAVAATETAALMPATPTPSLTPSATPTASVTPTPTPTFIFLLPTATSTPRPTSFQGGSATADPSQFACVVLSQIPASYVTMSRNAAFTLKWKVRNVGTSDWLSTSVDLVYVSGAKLSAATGFNFTTDVSSGSAITLSVPMTAPGASGKYSTKWTLRASHAIFCPLAFGVRVS